MSTLSSVMIALLVGLSIVVVGAGGTWFALFHHNAGRLNAALNSNDTEILPPSKSPARAVRARTGRTKRTADTNVAARASSSAQANAAPEGRPRHSARAAFTGDPYGDVRVGIGRRIRSAFLLGGITITVAAAAGAIISVAAILVVLVVT